MTGTADTSQLVERVAAMMASYPDPVVERVVFGTADPKVIVAQIDAWCQRHLADRIISSWLWAVSVGCVAGVTLGDGRSVVVKAHQPDRTEARLRGVMAVQERARVRGVPAPRPLAGPVSLGQGLATAEEARAIGRRPDLLRDPDRATAAAGWSRLAAAVADLTTLLADASGPAASVVGGLYPRPHSPLFDFDATSHGAAWIDDLARAARTITDELRAPAVIVHTDWRGDNLRVDDAGTELVAVFDWESVRVEPEAVALGQVAAMHSIDWSGPADPYFASGGECVAFARCVERARAAPFAADEWAAVQAAIVYGWSYTARCEHARAIVGDDKRTFRMRERLAADGASLLALARG